MGDRDRYQSTWDRNENRSRDDQARDRSDEWRSQSRDRDWTSGRDYGRELNREFGREPNRDYGRDYVPSGRSDYSRDYRDYGRDTERQYGSQYPERNYGQNFAGQEARRFPATFGSYEDQRYGREWNRDRSNETQRNFGYGSGYGYGQDLTARGYERDYRGHERDESFGQQLREAGQRFVGKVKRAFRGPKGYKRSDERIREDVSDRLSLHEDLDPTEIEVAVSNSEVTLTGSVTTRRDKFLAEEIADDVAGVTEVHNQLRVGRAQTQQSSYADTSASNQQSGTEANRGRNARAQ